MQLKRILLKSFAFNCIFLPLILCYENEMEERKLEILNQTSRFLEDEGEERLLGRVSFSTRKSLPAGDIFSTQQLHRLKCNGTHSVAKNGYIHFSLANTESKIKNMPCQYNFVGSRNEKCTVAILCKGKITLVPPSTNGCDKEVLVISDGTEGYMMGCGAFSFSNAPRIPRNNGSDLYFYIKGSSPTRCVAFCVEDLGNKHLGVKPPKRIAKNHQFEGLKMLSGCQCGIRRDKGRIVGGETAFKNEMNWIGGIVSRGGEYARSPFCGGSLVSDRYFISAAHCFMGGIDPWGIQVLLHAHVVGRKSFGNDKDTQKIPGWDLPEETDQTEESIRLDVQEIRIHPLFSIKTFDYDIAILKFKKSVNLKKGKVSPICLPYLNETFKFEDGTNMVVAGWGLPWENAPESARILQKLDVPYLNLQDCKTYTSPSHRHLCAGYEKGGKDACSGDSGGPLIYKFNDDANQYLLSGIVSAGAGCARKEKLGLYTDFQELMQWAYHHMPDALYCPRSLTKN